MQEWHVDWKDYSNIQIAGRTNSAQNCSKLLKINSKCLKMSHTCPKNPLKIAQNCSKSTQNVSKCLIPAPKIRSKLLKIAQNVSKWVLRKIELILRHFETFWDILGQIETFWSKLVVADSAKGMKKCNAVANFLKPKANRCEYLQKIDEMVLLLIVPQHEYLQKSLMKHCFCL